MSDEYFFFKIKENEFDILIPLMEDCFRMTTNIKYFEWKFKNNPAGFVEGYYAKHKNGEIAAYYGVIPEVYMVNGCKRVIYQSCDTMTHSRHRRKGLFQKLALLCYQNLRERHKLFIIGFGGYQSTPGLVKFGWKESFKMRYYFYPKFFKTFNNCRFSNVEKISDYAKIEKLCLMSNESYFIHSHKDLKVYNWRISNPLNNYETIAIKDKNNNYNSYVTYYESIDKIVLFDFYIKDYLLGKELFNYIKFKLKKNHKGIVAFVQEKSYLSETLSRYSFITNRLGIGALCDTPPFMFYTTEPEFSILSDSRKWLISSFDHDAL